MATEDVYDEMPAMELAQVMAPLSESGRARLTEYWSRVIAEVGADLPGRREVPVHPARRARRAERQRTVRLVRVLPSVHRAAVAKASGVAA